MSDAKLMSLVAKPEGFDLRAARASRGTASDWLPEDALYSASELMKESPATVAFLAVWYTRESDGKLSLKYRVYQEHERQGAALAADMLAWLTSP